MPKELKKRICKQCKIEKPLSDKYFYKRSYKFGCYHSYLCKKCEIKNNSKRNRNNPKMHREYNKRWYMRKKLKENTAT